ncbi:methyltransferase [Streptomyces sp. TX20-6-3]|uniref:methyltransferase n=1 Tax=Streptomyces sp. TX20-6-3 TaxID=3028705 RepID=UPI0034DF4939
MAQQGQHAVGDEVDGGLVPRDEEQRRGGRGAPRRRRRRRRHRPRSPTSRTGCCACSSCSGCSRRTRPAPSARHPWASCSATGPDRCATCACVRGGVLPGLGRRRGGADHRDAGVAHGVPLIAHLAGDPGAAARFQRVMQAGHAVFDAVPGVLGLSGPGRVLDLGGGDGRLLSTVLAAAPAARRVLVDLPHVLPPARAHLAATSAPGRASAPGPRRCRGLQAGVADGPPPACRLRSSVIAHTRPTTADRAPLPSWRRRASRP